ncbi:MAG TPA: aldo/keto reductase [Dongiaceae bacterium]|jgi:aryl-alcohol dehydrogenase-like predicted oxidoreductase
MPGFRAAQEIDEGPQCRRHLAAAGTVKIEAGEGGERTVERDLIPMAREMDLGVIPWSPLASGVPAGKYCRRDLAQDGGSADPRKNIAIAETVKEIVREIGMTPSQVALAWILLNPAVTGPIIGVRTLAQLEDNLGALDVTLNEDRRARLDQASAIGLGFPHEFLQQPLTRAVVFGGMKIESRI